MNLRQLKEKHNEHVVKIKALQDKENLTESEEQECETRFNEAESLKKKIEHGEKLKSLELASVEDRDIPNPRKEKRQYSLKRAIECLISGKMDGLEGETHKAFEERGINGFNEQSIIIPTEVIYGKKETRIVDGQSALVSDPIKPELAQLSLREASIMDKLGVSHIQATGNFNYPKNSNTTSAGWITGDGGTAANDKLTESDPTFTSQSVEPHFLGAMTGWSLKQLKEMSGNLSLENLLRRNLAMSLAEQLDKSMINGDSGTTAAEPDGFFELLGSSTNNTAKAVSSSSKWDLDDLTNEINELKKQYKNNRISPRWVIPPGTEKRWDEVQRFSGTDGESLLDYAMKKAPVVVTNHLSDTATAAKVILGDFSEFLVVTFDSIILELGMIDDDFQKGVKRLRAIGCFDFVMDRKEAFRQITVTRS